jgi:ammonia channel protein AmtB
MKIVRRSLAIGVITLIGLVLSERAFAAAQEVAIDSGDTLRSTAIVLMMTIPGLALFCGRQVLTQLYSVAVTMAYTALATFVILKAIDPTSGFRVTEESEREGLDIRAHGESVA